MAEDDTEAKDEAEDPASKSAVGNRTMQVDALLEEVDDDGALPEGAVAQVVPEVAAAAPRGPTAPPPLPPKRVGTGTIALGVIIVVLAAGGGIVFGMKFLGDPEPPAEATAEEPSAEAAVAEESAEDDGMDEEQLAADEMEEEGEFVPIQLDEVVVPHPNDELLDDEPAPDEE